MKRQLLGFLAIFVLVVGPVAWAAPDAAPTEHPSRAATQPTTHPAAHLSSSATVLVEMRTRRLTLKSLALLEKKKLDQAEPLLRQAIKLDPTSTINLYNLACVCALTHRADEAVKLLEQAMESGYTDFVHMGVDSDLSSLRDLPSYQELLKKKDSYQRKAAEKALAALTKQFGDSYLYEIDPADRLIFATNIDRQTLDSLKHDLEAQARSQWRMLFEHKPDEFIAIIIPSPADYRKIVKMPGVGGLYNDSAKMLIAQQLGQVITHEFTHALHAADRAPLEQDHPIWLTEGLASLFEAAQWEKIDNEDTLVPRDNFRLGMLQRAARVHKLLPLEKLLKMKQPEFIAKATFGYGESSSLLLYLYEHKQLRSFYDAYKAGYDKEQTGRAALELVTGQKLPELEKSWTAWLLKRPLPSLTTGPNGAFLGASLGGIGSGEANDGIRIGMVLAGGPADLAGIKQGDVLVGIDDLEVRDFQSFGPVLSQHKPGEHITLKIHRDGKYLEIPLVLGNRSEVLNAIAKDKPAATTQPAK